MPAENNRLEIIIEENKQLKTAVAELSVLNEIAIAVSSYDSLEEIIQLIVSKCIQYLDAEQGAVLLLDPENEGNIFNTMIRKYHNETDNEGAYHFNRQLSGWMLKNKTPLLINNINANGPIPLNEHGEKYKSILAAPLMIRGKITGVLSIYNKYGNDGFSEADKRLLSIIAVQSSQVIENARLAQKEENMKKTEEELLLASKIQLDLFPKKMPALPDYLFAGNSIPAKMVGGDYYDAVEIEPGKVAFCVADISGKGLPASLLMANLQAALRGRIFLKDSIIECVEFANKLLYANTKTDKFATLFYAELDAKNGSIEYCNAGHNPPILVKHNEEIVRLSIGGPIIGVFPEIHYNSVKCDIKENDVLIIFSDGVTEAKNKYEEEYGEERLINNIRLWRTEKPDVIMKKIIEQVEIFSKNVEQADDITIVVIKRVE